MNRIDKKITNYLKANTIFSLATSVDNKPYCAICFYAYEEEMNALIFSSDEKTRHIREGIHNSQVSGTIVNSKNEITRLQGIQFTGLFSEPEETMKEIAKKSYCEVFPFARLMQSPLWLINLEYIKMTDNTLVFGKKYTWEKTPANLLV